MTPTFSHCAARCLDNWTLKESKHYERMQEPTAEGVRSALSYFKVSRCFTSIDTDKVGKKIVSLVLAHDKHATESTAQRRVLALAAAFEKELSSKNLISAASKLLWLRKRSPFIIYDSRAARALLRIHSFNKRNYGEYCRAWRSSYLENREGIARALARLPKFTEFTAAASHGRASIAELTSSDWFAERTFDQYLWIIGEPPKPT